MIPLIAFCGASGSGKTTLASAVIRWFGRRGYRVGAIKHHGHPGAVQRVEAGKDTELLSQAGANPVALCHGGGVDISIDAEDSPWGPAAVAGAFMAGLDLVVVEGFKSSRLDKIEVVGAGRQPMLPSGGRLVAIAGVEGAGRQAAEAKQIPWFDAGDVDAVGRFIRDRMKKSQPAPGDVRLTIDGRQMPLNDFVQKIIANVVRGMLGSLKGGEVDGPLELHID